jgi:hypothetical protein
MLKLKLKFKHICNTLFLAIFKFKIKSNESLAIFYSLVKILNYNSD